MSDFIYFVWKGMLAFVCVTACIYINIVTNAYACTHT